MAAGADRVRALLGGLDALPPMPPVAQRLMELGDLARADIADVAGLIEMDPALTAGVLSMCRAAHTGLGDRITTVRRAVTMLGVACVRRLVLTTAVCETLRDGAAELETPVGDDVFDREGYWVFCVATACASERLASETGRASPDQVFVAGLLHGIGRLALELVAPRAATQICRLAARGGVDAAVAERRVLGLDHHGAGAHLAARWGLPPELVAVIRDDAEGEHDALVGVVREARRLCRWAYLGWSGDWGPIEDVSDGALGLDAQRTETVLRGVIAGLGPRLVELGVLPEPADASGASVAMLVAQEANRAARIRAMVRGPRTGSGDAGSGATAALLAA